MFSAFEEKDAAVQGARERQRHISARRFLDENPQFETRFTALTERYAILPAEIIMPMAQQTNIPVDAQSFQDIAERYQKNMWANQANNYIYVQEDRRKNGNPIDWAQKYLNAVGGRENSPEEMFRERRREDRTILTPIRTASLWTISLFEGLSEILVKYSPHFIGKYENDKVKYNKETGEFDLVAGNMEDLNSMQRALVAVPGGQYLLPGNKPQFAGRVFAYAQQMNALDRFIEEGKTLDYAKQFVPIDFEDSYILKESDFGEKENWLKETKDWLRFWKEGADVGGSPYVLEMLNQVKRGQPVNINTKNWLSVESVMAEDDPLVQDLIDSGEFTRQEAIAYFYAQKGAPIVKPNLNGDINWTSIQKPNQIELFAGRRYIQTPELAEEYTKNRVYNINEQLGTKVPYSHGRYSAGLKFKVGSTQYNTMSGIIDGSARLFAELGFYKTVKGIKKLSKLSKSPNELAKYADDELYSPVKKKEIVTNWIKQNKKNPITGQNLENVDEFIDTFDNFTGKFVKPLRTELKNARVKTSKLKKEYGLIGGWVPRMFSKNADDMVDLLDDTGMLDALVANKSNVELIQNPWTREFPEEIHDVLIKSKDKNSLKNFMRRMYADGVQLPGMDMAFQLDELPKGRAYLRGNLRGKTPSPTVMSLAGRAVNRTLRAVDETYREGKRFAGDMLKSRKTKVVDDTQFVTRKDLDIWEATGEYSLGRGLGFYGELTAGMNPRFKKAFSIQPQSVLSYNNRNEAYRTLGNHLLSTGYSTARADLILDEFRGMKHTIENIDEFSEMLFKNDIAMVAQRKGLASAKFLEDYVKKSRNQELQITNYFSSPEGNMIHDQWTPRFVDEVTGDTTFIPSVTKISETAKQGAPLTDNRALNRVMSELFDVIPGLEDASIMETTAAYIKSLAKNKGLSIPTKHIAGGTIDNLASLYMNDLLKPWLIAKPALTSRVVLEEQLFFSIFPALYGMFDRPDKYFSWLFSYGYMPKRGPLRELVKKLKLSGEDINEVTQSQYFHEAINAQLSYSGFKTASINKSMIDYKTVSPDNPWAFDGYLFQFLKLHNDPISRALAKIENGNPDEIVKWSKTAEAIKLRERLINLTGPKYVSNKETTIRKQENWLQYLFARENEIRMRTGMKMTEGTHYIRIVKGTNGGEYAHDISHAFTGSQELRKGIAYGEFNNVNGKKTKLAAKWDSDNPYEKYTVKNQQELKDTIEGYVGLKNDAGEAVYDFGYVVVPSAPAIGKIQKLFDKGNDMYGSWFEFLLQSPTARLNRSPIFKQYRWLKLSAHFDKFTPALQQKFYNEAVAAKVPKYLLNELQGTMSLGHSGTVNSYEAWSNLANSYAVSMMKSVLYDTKNKHRISEVTRNIIPFPEVFIEMGKRWSKAVAANPYSIRAASTAQDGLTSWGGNYSYYGQGRWGEDPVTGETVFLYPAQVMHSDMAFGTDVRFRENMVGFAGGVNMVSTQTFPSGSPIVQYYQNMLFDSKFGQMVGFDQEFQDEFFGSFPPPESMGEALGVLGNIPWIKQARVAGNPANIIFEKFSDTYVDKDNQFMQWDMNNKFNSMRAETTIDFWNDAKISNSDVILLENGKLDKYIRKLMPNWDGNRKVASQEEMLKWHQQNGNIPYQYSEGELSNEVLDRALMMYSAHEARWFALTRSLFQFTGAPVPTGPVIRSAVQDTTGKWWSTAVLADYYDELVQKHFGDHRLAAEEFANEIGLDHGYILTSSKDKSPFATVWDQKIKVWKDEHIEEINQLPLTYHYLNTANPENERTYSDVIAQATQNPEFYLRSANDTVGWFKYDQFKKQTEELVKLGQMSPAEAEYHIKSYRLALIETHPGFQASYGQTEQASTKERFKEMRDKWTTLDFAKEYESGLGFNKFMEYWLEAEKLSVEMSGTGSTTWWLTSNSQDAYIIRKRISDQAYAVIADYPDFMPIYQNVIIRMFSSDRNILEYNSYLAQRRERVGS